MTDEEPNAWLELVECLSTLDELLGHLVDPELPQPAAEELVTACWQTIELVTALGAENDEAWRAIDGLRTLVNELQGNLADKGLWTPAL